MQKNPFKMKATGERLSVDARAFLDNEVMPAVFRRLDQIFPAFGWRKDSKGWVASEREHTKREAGARPARVVCHETKGRTPEGFFVIGGESTHWLAYINRGRFPEGAEWFECVKKLADLAGVDASCLDREPTEEEVEQHKRDVRRGSLLETFARHTGESLMGEARTAGREYLVGKRGFREADLVELGFGFVPKLADVRSALEKAGFSGEEIEGSGLLADGRWEGRITCVCRDHRGQIQGAWARDITGQSEESAKYLKNRGFVEKTIGFYGLDVALKTEAGRKNLVIVEGQMDALLMQSRGLTNVAALGASGSSLSTERWEALAKMGVRSVTLALDNDAAGHAGGPVAVKHHGAAKHALDLWVVDPAAWGDCKDPDELVRKHGLEAFTNLLDRRISGAVYRGRALLGGVNEHSPDHEKREAIGRVLDFVAGLRGPSASLDLEDVLRAAVEATGYSGDALALAAQAHKDRLAQQEMERGLKSLLREAGDKLEEDPAAVAAKLSTGLAELKARTEDRPVIVGVNQLLEEIANRPKPLTAGLDALERVEVGFYAGELALLAARTGHGKTSVMCNLLYGFVTRDKVDGTVLFYSHEEPVHAIFLRLLALAIADRDPARREVSVRDLRRQIEGREIDPAAAGAIDLVRGFWGSRVQVVWRPGWTVEVIAGHALAVGQEQPVSAVLLDYLQRVPVSDGTGNGRRRDEEISAIGRRLKTLSEELTCPVVAGAQINREATKDTKPIREVSFDSSEFQEAVRKRSPQLHHLREGGSEQEADLVLGLLNHGAEFEPDGLNPTPRVGRIDVIPLKNRYGVPGQRATFDFYGASGLLEEGYRGCR